jgi:hypothetical protein
MVDITPLENDLIALVGTVVTGLGTWLIGAGALYLQRHAKWLGAQRIAQMRDMADDAVGHAIASGQSELAKQLPGSVDPHSFVVKMAMQYAIDHDKSLLADAGVDVDDPDALTQKIEARMATYAPGLLPVPGASMPAPAASAAALASPPPAPDAAAVAQDDKPIDIRNPVDQR